MYKTESFSYSHFCFIGLLLCGISACNNNGNNIDSALPAAIEKKVLFVPLYSDSLYIMHFLEEHPLFAYHASEIKTFYQNRQYQFGWFDSSGITEPAGNFANLLNHFNDEGLRDSVIYLSEVNNLLAPFMNPAFSFTGKTMNAEELEILLTAQFFVYAQKVWGGMSEEETKELHWYIRRKTIPTLSLLDSILNGNASAFTKFQPVYHQYNLLKEQLKNYHILDSIYAFDSIFLPADKRYLQPGDTSMVIRYIKQRLFALGDLPVADSTIIYNPALEIAIKNFQDRHGLKPDGHAGSKFFVAINASLKKKIQQIEINMERCRWIPTDLSGDYVTVNIPEFKAYVYAKDTLSWTMNVIVGRSSTSTVIFNDEIEYIVFSPYWYVPGSIIRNEIIPGILKNENYLFKNDMELFDYSTRKIVNSNGIDFNKYKNGGFPYGVRQKPGANNSLGWVKFIFPNAHDIYMHDTPSRNLFAEVQRTFSHGCIRVSEPKKFAAYLLQSDTIWTTSKIDSVMYSGKELIINLPQKIPVLITYFTTWVDANGILQFRDDIYSHDKKMLELPKSISKL